MGQDAYKNGPMFFQLTNAAGNRTHAGLLEFSAAEGFVALPRKVGGWGGRVGGWAEGGTAAADSAAAGMDGIPSA